MPTLTPAPGMALRWYMQPGYESRRTVPKAWHCFEVAPADEREQGYPDRPTLCGKSLPFHWRGAMVDSMPDPLDLSELFRTGRWKKVCVKCRSAAEALSG